MKFLTVKSEFVRQTIWMFIGISLFNLVNKVMAARCLSPGEMRRLLGTYKLTFRELLDAG